MTKWSMAPTCPWWLIHVGPRHDAGMGANFKSQQKSKRSVTLSRLEEGTMGVHPGLHYKPLRPSISRTRL